MNAAVSAASVSSSNTGAVPAVEFIDPSTDPWHVLGDEGGPDALTAPAPHLLLTPDQWHAVRAGWPASSPVGVVLPCDADVESLAPELEGLAVVALDFPKWTDGRAYSQAHLLRLRYRFKGQIRATGDVVADMLPLLRRTGFDAVVLRADQSRDVAQRALGFFPDHYQGDVVDHAPRFAGVAR